MTMYFKDKKKFLKFENPGASVVMLKCKDENGVQCGVCKEYIKINIKKKTTCPNCNTDYILWG
ncbi:hypothetical protein [Bacillus cereus]|uniref:hypothetical protein n=1 Tax=Bacillus cereus TaxID=1396 RepID=UPI000BFC47D5|nr:hypothetical protein [Bacillus cereus]PGY94670.1 hypothetical protein COE05_12665 [Bacillus cereus]